METASPVLFFPGSGTAGLEAAVANLVSPGESVVFCTVGSFGDRWVDIARHYGADVVVCDAEWGSAVTTEKLSATLDANPKVRKIFITHNETSTGVCHDLAKMAALVKGKGLLLAVDAVSSASCVPIQMDTLGIDCVVTASQKGWMAPPGLTMVAVSDMAMSTASTCTSPRWYFDFQRELDMQVKGETSTTPPVSVLYALQEGLAMMKEEGLPQVFARHARIAKTVREGVERLGLKLLADPDSRSNTVTAIVSPTEDPDVLKTLLGTLRKQEDMVLAGGQGKLKGKIFRIGHMGWITDDDASEILEKLEKGLVMQGLAQGAAI
jgi:aspartate aminotransferase-like enzyme